MQLIITVYCPVSLVGHAGLVRCSPELVGSGWLDLASSQPLLCYPTMTCSKLAPVIHRQHALSEAFTLFGACITVTTTKEHCQKTQRECTY